VLQIVYIKINQRELSQQKYCEIQLVTAPLFWLTVPDTPKKQALSAVFDLQQLDDTVTTGMLQTRIMFILPMQCRENQVESLEYSKSRQQHDPNLAMHRVHMEPFNMRLHALPFREKIYRSRDHPNDHELINHIRHPSPAPGLLSPGAPGKVLRTWCGIVPVSPTGTT
jgi:hypothetical protein